MSSAAACVGPAYPRFSPPCPLPLRPPATLTTLPPAPCFPASLLRAGIDAINKDVKELRNAAQHEMVLSEESEPDSVVSYLTQLKESVEAQMAEAQRINKYQVLFKLGESTCDDLNDTAEEISLKLGLWTGMAEFEALTQAWTGTHFDSLDVVAMEEAVVRFHKAVFKMERGLTPNKLVPRLRAHVDKFRNLLPVVQALRNRALKERHWTKIFEVIGQVRQGDRAQAPGPQLGPCCRGVLTLPSAP